MSSTAYTFIGDDIDVTVYYDIQPHEPKTLEYPGCDADIEITAVLIDGACILGCLNQKTLDSIKENIMSHPANQTKG